MGVLALRLAEPLGVFRRQREPGPLRVPLRQPCPPPGLRPEPAVGPGPPAPAGAHTTEGHQAGAQPDEVNPGAGELAFDLGQAERALPQGVAVLLLLLGGLAE